MVARTRTEPNLLLITFETDGDEPEQELAPTGERALKAALLLLAKRHALRHGDRLTVVNADD
jgi:hypothetical protein